MKSITIKMPEELLNELDEEARKSNYSRSELIRAAIEGRSVIVLEDGKEIAKAFVNYCDLIVSGDSSDVEREGVKICRLLNAVISKLEDVH